MSCVSVLHVSVKLWSAVCNSGADEIGLCNCIYIYINVHIYIYIYISVMLEERHIFKTNIVKLIVTGFET